MPTRLEVPATAPADPAATQLILADAGAPGRPRRALPSGAAAGATRHDGAAAALISPVIEDDDRRDALWLASAALLRVVAVVWVVGAVVLWARLVGYGRTPIVPQLYSPGGPWLTTTAASVVFPVVAVGLWLLGRWGLVVWAAAIAAGTALFAVRPDLVPFGVAGLAANVVAALAFAALAIVRLIRTRAAE